MAEPAKAKGKDATSDEAGSDAADPWANPTWILTVMAGMRGLLQRTGALLGTAATALIGGLGYTQLHNIFPIPKNVSSCTEWLLGGSVLAGFGGAVWLAAIFFMAQRQVLIGTTWDDDLVGPDRRIARRIEEEYAHEENAPDIRAVELRALRLAGIARALGETDAARAKATKAESDRLLAVVHLALVRTAAGILEERSRRAFHRWPTIAALVLAVLGIVGIFSLSDYYKGQRDVYQARVKCAQAEAAGIPDACAAFETPAQTKARQSVQQASAALAAAKAKAALDGLSSAQMKMLTQTALCQAAIAALPANEQPSAAALPRAVALCAAAG